MELRRILKIRKIYKKIQNYHWISIIHIKEMVIWIRIFLFKENSFYHERLNRNIQIQSIF